MKPCLLLLDKLGRRAIKHDIRPKNRRGQWRVHILGGQIELFSIQDKVVSVGPKTDGRRLAEQDEGEDIAVLSDGSISMTFSSSGSPGRCLPFLCSPAGTSAAVYRR